VVDRVADDKGALAADADPVGLPEGRPRGWDPIAPVAVVVRPDPRHSPNRTMLRVQGSDDVVLALRDVENAGRRHGYAAGTAQGGPQRRAAIARVAPLPGPGHPMDGSSLEMQPPQAVPRHGCNPKVLTPNGQPLRREKRLVAGLAALARELTLSVARDGLDLPGRRVNPPHAMIPQVGDIEVVRFVQGDAVGHAEPRLPGRAAVTAVTGDAIAGHRGDRPGSRVDPPDRVALHVQDEHVAVGVEADLIGLVQRRLCRRPAVSRVAFMPIPGHRSDLAAVAVEPQHAVAAYRRDVQGPVGTVLHPKGEVHGYLGRLAAAFGSIARRAIPGQGFDTILRIGPRSGRRGRQRGGGPLEGYDAGKSLRCGRARTPGCDKGKHSRHPPGGHRTSLVSFLTYSCRHRVAPFYVTGGGPRH
jgi:hypothetical protein